MRQRLVAAFGVALLVLAFASPRAGAGQHWRAVLVAGDTAQPVFDNAIRAVELALQLSGNHGLTRHNPLERHWRDVLCSRIHTPQNDAVLVAAGKRALKEANA